MGQKINPHGLRVGVVKDWDAKWYANKEDYADLLHEDLEVRNHIQENMSDAAVSRVVIERAANRIKVNIHTARPGMVIGKGGSEVNNLRANLEEMTAKKVQVNVVEIKQPDKDAQLVAQNIAEQIENRISFRRAMKQAIGRTMKSRGVEGIKVECAGRLNGADMARTEGYSEGSVPLHTLRADIDYGFIEANTTYGKIGVKIWIYKGEILPEVSEG